MASVPSCYGCSKILYYHGHCGRTPRPAGSGLGVEYIEAALHATGRQLIVVDQGELKDDLVQDVVAVMTSLCARLYGRRAAKNRAQKAVGGGVGERVMLLAHQIRLDRPVNTQRTFFAQCVGVSRFAGDNWALDEWQSQYACRRETARGAAEATAQWDQGGAVPLDVGRTEDGPEQQAIKNLGNAFDRFFTKLGTSARSARKSLSMTEPGSIMGQ